MNYMLGCVVLGCLTFSSGCVGADEPETANPSDTETSVAESSLTRSGTGATANAISGCTFSYDLSRGLVAATCMESAVRDWDVQVQCERPTGMIVRVKGSIVHGPGTGTSLAQCPVHTEVGQQTIVEL